MILKRNYLIFESDGQGGWIEVAPIYARSKRAALREAGKFGLPLEGTFHVVTVRSWGREYRLP